MANYGFEHEGKVYGPDGLIDRGDGTDTATHNRNIERDEIAWLRTAPDRVFLYVKKHDTTEETYQNALSHGWTPDTTKRENWKNHKWEVGTWLGTSVATHVYIGRSVPVGGIAGRWAKKRAVDCRIFGVRYVGWFWESSGDYCRLKKAKRQPKPRV